MPAATAPRIPRLAGRRDGESLPAPTPHRSSSRRRRKFLRRRPPKLTWQAASFGFSLATVFVVIASLWSIAPIAFLYVVWTVVTLAPALSPYRPAPSHVALKVLHYTFLAYCACEIPFTVYYRYLAIREQKLRPPLRHPRKVLRGLILRSLENGLTLEEEFEQEEHERDDGGKRSDATDLDEKSPERAINRQVDGKERDEKWVEQAGANDDASGSNGSSTGRRRTNRFKGDGAATPEIANSELAEASDYLTARNLPVLRTDDAPIQRTPTRSTIGSANNVDEGFAGSRYSVNTVDSAFASSPLSTTNPYPLSNAYPPPTHRKKRNHAFHHGAPVAGFIDPPLSPSDRRAIDFRSYVRYWFSGCDFSEIKRLNMADWLAWSLYGVTLEELEAERKQWDQDGRPPLKLADGTLDEDDSDLDEDTAIEGDRYGLVMHCVDLVEARAAHRFEPGRNDKIRTLRLTLDPVRVTQRPLILYLFVAALQNGVLAAAKLRGFKELRDEKVKYLARIPKDWRPNSNGPESQRPLVFIHGLGMGSAQYATFMSYLCSHRSFRDRPILILLQPHISMSFFEKGYLDPPDQKGCTQSLERMMKRLKFHEAGGATVLSHSNGTIVHAWLVKDCPTLCARNAFVDAVCFCLWEPFVCYNFLYSKPKTPIEYLMRYFVSRELGIAVMLSRTFEWTSNLLFPSQIPHVSDPTKTAVFLAEQDSILNAERVKTYLKRNGLLEVQSDDERVGRVGGGNLKVFKGLKHGQSMIGEGAAFEEIMEFVCQAPRGTLAPGTASPAQSLPPSLAGSGAEDSTAEGSMTADEPA
ncbi:hypothetical protein JCM10212_002933 [Sporobolomyces blumeae]